MSGDEVGRARDLDPFEQYLCAFRDSVASRPRLSGRILSVSLRENVVVVRLSDGRDALIPLVMRPDGVVAHEGVQVFPPRAAGA